MCSSSLAARIDVVLRLHIVLLLKPRNWNNLSLANSCGLGCGLARGILEVCVTLFWCSRVLCFQHRRVDHAWLFKA